MRGRNVASRRAMRCATLLVILVVAALTIAACGGGHSYQSRVKHNFLSACEQNTSSSRCECVLHKVEAQKSESELAVAEHALLAGSSPPSWLIKDVEQCVQHA